MSGGSRRALVMGLLLAAVLLTLLRSWEPTGETWVYWFGTRVFGDTGRFVVLDRSPVYSLYLGAFTWLPFPAVLIAEYIFSTLVVGIALAAFGERHLGRWGGPLAALVWIPVLQIAEPPGQKLALAASLGAVLLRMRSLDRRSMVLSYLFLALAYLARTNWLALLVTFAAYDVWRELRKSGLRSLARAIIPRPATDWPLLLPVLAVAWILAMQSPLPRNNIMWSTTTWFPSPATTFTNGTFISLYNTAYVAQRYPAPQDQEDKDWYFTNREAFGGADDMIGAIGANPTFFAEQLLRSTVLGVRVAAGQTLPDSLVSWLPGGVVLEVILLAVLGHAAFRASRPHRLEPLVVGNALMIAAVVFAAGPRQRYIVVALIPILLLAASFYGHVAASALDRLGTWSASLRRRLALGLLALMAVYLAYLVWRLAAGRYVPVGPVTATLLALLGIAVVAALLRPERAGRALARAALSVSVVVLSLGLNSWESVVGDAVSRVRLGDFRLMQGTAFSAVAAQPRLASLLRGCRGVMAEEHRFIGAFVDLPLDSVLDIWEIPPFGRLDASEYDGLRPSRVDCVIVSDDLVNEIGGGTNVRLRYKNYIRPYVDRLIADGALEQHLDRFGVVIRVSPR